MSDNLILGYHMLLYSVRYTFMFSHVLRFLWTVLCACGNEFVPLRVCGADRPSGVGVWTNSPIQLETLLKFVLFIFLEGILIFKTPRSSLWVGECSCGRCWHGVPTLFVAAYSNAAVRNFLGFTNQDLIGMGSLISSYTTASIASWMWGYYALPPTPRLKSLGIKLLMII